MKDKIETLKEYLKDKKCILAFSAGSDSTLLAYILSQASQDSMLITIDNNMMPSGFIEYAVEKAKEFNLKHEIIKTDFLKDSEFIENNPMRCYNCRKIMYQLITEMPYFCDYDYFIEGTNLTDLLEDRPGTVVRKKYNMTSPLIECHMTKDDVFNIIKYLNLDYSRNTTCLATRVKTNEKVNKNKFKLIDEAEKLVKEYIKQENIRVRFENYNAIITVDNPLEILNKEILKVLRDKLQELGFKKVLLDITGYAKTKLNYSRDKNGYYYKLPYEIDLKETLNKLKENSDVEVNLKEDYIQYEDMIIKNNGKISMLETEDFNNKLNSILPFIERNVGNID